MSTTDVSTAAELHVERWGAGSPVVLVHGSLAAGAQEWDAQKPLADQGFRLTVLDRRGYGSSPAAPGEDFIVDGADVAVLLGDGAHIVGHSYGGIGRMAMRCVAILPAGSAATSQSSRALGTRSSSPAAP